MLSKSQCLKPRLEKDDQTYHTKAKEPASSHTNTSSSDKVNYGL